MVPWTQLRSQNKGEFMGNEFFWFLDLFVIALIGASMFRGAKKGAVAVLISSVTAIVAFLAAFFFSGPVTDLIYDSFVRDKVEDYMEERLGSSLDSEMIKGISAVDMNKAKLNDNPLSETLIVYDNRDRAIIDLSRADLSATGIEKADLRSFGIDDDFDWSLIKAGKITVTRSEMEKYGLGNIVLSHLIATNITSGKVFDALTDIGDRLGETISPSLRNLGGELSGGSNDAVYTFLVSIITASNSSFSDRIMNDIISPMVSVPLQAIVFCIIFGLIALVLGIIANVSKIINKIPIVSSVNGVIGAVLGVLEAAVGLLLVCIVIKALISLCENQLVFLNDLTISRTILFRHIYAFDPFSLFR